MKQQMFIRFSLFTAFVFTLGCTSFKQQSKEKDTTNDVAILGNDTDEHGCIGSAGYQWSALRQECVRLHEVGIRLDPQAGGLDKTLSAFVVFKSLAETQIAEVYIPAEKKPATLTKEKNAATPTWKNNQYTLSQQQEMYSLTNAKGALLYQGAAK